jgi:hypothetical protein
LGTGEYRLRVVSINFMIDFASFVEERVGGLSSKVIAERQLTIIFDIYNEKYGT